MVVCEIVGGGGGRSVLFWQWWVVVVVELEVELSGVVAAMVMTGGSGGVW